MQLLHGATFVFEESMNIKAYQGQIQKALLRQN